MHDSDPREEPIVTAIGPPAESAVLALRGLLEVTMEALGVNRADGVEEREEGLVRAGNGGWVSRGLMLVT